MNRGKWLLVGVALALIIAACGGGAAATPTAAPATPAAVATSTPTPSGAPRPTPTPLPQASPTPTTAPAPTGVQPKYGGVLIVPELQNRFDWDDLLFIRVGQVHTVLAPMMSTLVQVDPFDESRIIPDLATEWTLSSNGLTATFKLGKNITWHDGKPFVAADVVKTVDRITSPAAGRASHLAILFDAVTRVSAPDDSTVVMELSRRKASMVRDMGNSWLRIYPFSRMTIENFRNSPVGTGPFQLVDFRLNVGTTLKRNTSFFRKDSQGRPLPYLDGVEVPVIRDSALNYASFVAGKTTVSGQSIGFPTGTEDRIQKDVPGAWRQENYGSVKYLQFNQVAPYTNLKVREAVHLTLDRKELKELGSLGRGSEFGWAFAPPEFGGAWGLPKSEYQQDIAYTGTEAERLARARQLLSEAGLRPADLKPVLLCDLPFLERDCSIIASEFGKLGSTLSVDAKNYLDARVEASRGAFQIFADISSELDDDPQFIMAGMYLREGFGPGRGVTNRGKWQSARITALYDQQEGELDPAKRKQLVQEMERETYKEKWSLFYHHSGGPGGQWYQPYAKGIPKSARTYWANRWRWETAWLDK